MGKLTDLCRIDGLTINPSILREYMLSVPRMELSKIYPKSSNIRYYGACHYADVHWNETVETNDLSRITEYLYQHLDTDVFIQLSPLCAYVTFSKETVEAIDGLVNKYGEGKLLSPDEYRIELDKNLEPHRKIYKEKYRNECHKWWSQFCLGRF